MPGFPVRLREKAEFIECGFLNKVEMAGFVRAIEKFGGIEQRLGK